ncbi:MAG: energy transducer TonB [Alphaproteobacteria bacterium]|nr:energy transducer TonB [Alphaproteobacteria bacterium]
MRDDEEAAAILADLFYRAGFQTAGGAARPDELDACAVALICWSGASQRSTQMREAADRAAQSGKAMIARLDGHPLPPSLWRLPAFDLSQWSFAPEDPVLDGLYVAVERTVTRARDAATRMGRVAAPAVEPPAAPRGQTVSGSDLEAEASFWKRIQTSNDPADFLAYLDQFGPKGAFAELALLRIERLGGAAPKAQPAAARAQPKAEPAAPAGPAWTGWSVQPGAVRPPRFNEPAAETIDDRLDRRQPDRRPLDPPPPRRPEPPRQDTMRDLGRDLGRDAGRDMGRHDQARHDQARHDQDRRDQDRRDAYARDLPPDTPQRPAPPRLDPVAPDARRGEPRRSDPRYLPPPPAEDLPPSYRAPSASRRPRYDDDDYRRGEPPPEPTGGRAARAESGGGGRGLLLVLLAVAALAGGGYAMRGLVPKGGEAPASEARAGEGAPGDDVSLASTGQEILRGSAPPIASDPGLTPPPRGEGVSLDSIGVTETAPSSTISPALRDGRRGAEARGSAAPQRYASSAGVRPQPRDPGPDPNAAYVPPPAATLPPAEQPVIVQPAPMPPAATPMTTSPPQGPSAAASADAPVREPAKVRWAARPTAERLEQLYPSRARSGEVSGAATLRCTILPTGKAACSVVSETPSGYGFGQAALRASESFRAAATLDDGSNSTGAIADVVIRFKVQ